MTGEQWAKVNYIDKDIKYLQDCGFTVEIKEFESEAVKARNGQAFFVEISGDEMAECVFKVRYVEVIASVLREYRRMTVRGKA